VKNFVFIFLFLFSVHAREALELSKMQETTHQLEHQKHIKVNSLIEGRSIFDHLLTFVT